MRIAVFVFLIRFLSMLCRPLSLLKFNAVESFHVGVMNPDSSKWCIVMESISAGTRVPYFNTFSNRTEMAEIAIDEASVTSTGNCEGVWSGMSIETLTINFLPANLSAATKAKGRPEKNPWSVSIVFGAPHTEDVSFRIIDFNLTAVFYADTFNVSADVANKPILFQKTQKTQLEWTASSRDAFSCSVSDLNQLTGDASFHFAGLKVIAFAMLEKKEFPRNQNYVQCRKDSRKSEGHMGLIIALVLFLIVVGGAVTVYFCLIKRRQQELLTADASSTENIVADV